MHPHVTDVFTRLDQARATLSAAVDAVPAHLRGQRPGADRWSVAEVLEHLSLVEKRFAGVVATAIAKARDAGLGAETGARAPFPEKVSRRMRDRTERRPAPDAVQPSGSVDADTAWSACEHSRQLLRATITDADGLALSQVVQDHHLWGPLDMYHWVELAADHQRRHADQIREVADHFGGSR